MYKIASTRFDALAYGVSGLLYLMLTAYLGIYAFVGTMSWRHALLSTGLLFIGIDHLAVAYWLQKFSVTPSAIFFTVGNSILAIYCISSLRLGSVIAYAFVAATVIVFFASFRSSIVLDAYYRSMAAAASVLFLYLYVSGAQYVLYLALAASSLLHAFALTSQTLSRRVEGILVTADATIVAFCAILFVR